MTRGDIGGNYLGLTVETISRLLGRFRKRGMLAVKVSILPIEKTAMRWRPSHRRSYPQRQQASAKP